MADGEDPLSSGSTIYRRPLGVVEGKHARHPSLDTSTSIRRIGGTSLLATSTSIPNVANLVNTDLPANAAGLRHLMGLGKWKEVVRLAEKCLKFPSPDLQPRKPHEMLQFRLSRVIAYLCLREYKVAADELDAMKMESEGEDSPHRYELYPQFYEGKSGSFFPFSARLFRAELPSYQGNVLLSVDMLHILLSSCRAEIKRLRDVSLPVSASNTFPSSFALQSLDGPTLYYPSLSSQNFALSEAFDVAEVQNDVATWRKRESIVLQSILARYLFLREYGTAMLMLKEIMPSHPSDISLFAAAFRIYLQVGNITKAEEFCGRMADIYQRSDRGNVEEWICLQMSKGLLALANDRYAEAIEYFDSILAKQPSNYIAANNRSIAYLFSCKLQQVFFSFFFLPLYSLY